MNSVLTGPIVTDYAPAMKPPWVVLAFTVSLLALVMPREVLPEFGLAAAGVSLGGWFVNRWFARPTPPTEDVSDG